MKFALLILAISCLAAARQPQPILGAYSKPIRGYIRKDGAIVRPHTIAQQPGHISTPSKPSVRPPPRNHK